MTAIPGALGIPADEERYRELRQSLTESGTKSGTKSGTESGSRSGTSSGSKTETKEISWWRAPGRVNLIGDHTDYAGGLALPMAIDRDCLIGVAARADGVAEPAVRAHLIALWTLDLSRKKSGEKPRKKPSKKPSKKPRKKPSKKSDAVEIANWDFPTSPIEPAWGRFVAAAMAVVANSDNEILESRKRGIELALTSTVPPGSGLSSSSALSVALVGALSQWVGKPLGGNELAQRAHQAEVMATGVPSGLMDQLASVYGQAGHALLIDFESITVTPVALPKELAVVVVNSGVPRALATSEYSQRRSEVEAAAKQLGLNSLRNATLSQVGNNPRARHVVSENNRVVKFVEALQSGSIDNLGSLMDASHASLRDDFGVSTPELDALVAALREAGAVGARLTGAGFGGCVVALVPNDAVTETTTAALASYRSNASPEIGRAAAAFVVHAVDGAGPVNE